MAEYVLFFVFFFSQIYFCIFFSLNRKLLYNWFCSNYVMIYFFTLERKNAKSLQKLFSVSFSIYTKKKKIKMLFGLLSLFHELFKQYLHFYCFDNVILAGVFSDHFLELDKILFLISSSKTFKKTFTSSYSSSIRDLS